MMKLPGKPAVANDRERRTGRRDAVRNRAGMTIIELLVAVTIMVIMILAFGTILTQSRRVVSGTQRMIRSNSQAAALGQTFRQDIRRATQQGLLCITQTAPGSSPRLLITIAGPVPSKTRPLVGTGGFAHFGLSANASPMATPGNYVLFAQRWVLIAGAGMGGDIWATMDLANVQALRRHDPDPDKPDMNKTCTNVCDFSPGGMIAPVSIPPRDLSEVNALWQVLADKCQWLSIMWTDGTDTGGALNWYGIDRVVTNDQGTPDPEDDVWEYQVRAQSGSAWEDLDIAHETIEFDADDNDTYRALWTHHDQNNWPKAIRIRFKLPGQAPYEVICPVGG